MNVGDDDIIRQLSDECSKLNNQQFKLIFRDATYAIFMHPFLLIAWYVSSKARGWGESSPKNDSDRRTPELMSGRVTPSLSKHFGAFPIAVPWHEVFAKNKIDVYQSVLLFPGGLRCQDPIKMVEVLKRDRIAVAILTRGNRLVVFSDTAGDEPVPVGERAFNVDLLVDVDGLEDPNSLSIQPSTGGSGESLFITDSASDRVCELRFDSTVLGIPRSCPEVSLVYWLLESGVPPASGSRLTVRLDSDGNSCIQIVGSASNGDSQGLVKLLAARHDWFTATKSLFAGDNFEPSLFATAEFLFCNSERTFRILRNGDYDFPVFIRAGLTQVRVVSTHGGVWIFALANESLRTFMLEDNGMEFTSVPVLESVVRFDSALDRITGLLLLVIATADGVSLLRLSPAGDRWDCLETLTLSSGVTSLSVRPAVSSDDAASFAVVARDGSFLASRELASFQLSLDGERCRQCMLAEDHLVVATDDLRLLIFSLMKPSGPPSVFVLPSDANPSLLQYYRRGAELTLIAGHLLVRRSFDPLAGIVWAVVDSGLRGTLAVEETEIYFSSSGGHISHCSVPPLGVTDTATFRLLQECHLGALPNDPDWYALRSELRQSVERLMDTSSEASRSSDSFARRFLVSEAFSRFSPDAAPLTFEDLAWAGLSDAQSFIVSELFKDPTVSWEGTRRTGLGYWCSEPSSFKDMAERIQKSALQEYMRTKDAAILDEKLAVWLSVLGKQQLLASLYKQHGSSCASPVHTRIAQFLATDFSSSENAAKAVKNAFELVRQKRNGMAVAVFLLAGAFQEAADICSRQMKDVQLALTVLTLLKLRMGIDHSVIDGIINSVWENRIVPTLNECGDVFLPLLWCWMRKDLDAALRVTRHESFTQVPEDSELGPFKIRPQHLSGVDAFLLAFIERMRRLNRPILDGAAAISLPSDEEKAYMLLQTGCSRLAKRSPNFHNFSPALRWAIQNNLSSSPF